MWEHFRRRRDGGTLQRMHVALRADVRAWAGRPAGVLADAGYNGPIAGCVRDTLGDTLTLAPDPRSRLRASGP